MKKTDIMYIELNNWFSGRDYPAVEPIAKWVVDGEFCSDEFCKEQGIVVVCGVIDMSMNYCITAPKEWVEKTCPFFLSNDSYEYRIHRMQGDKEWYVTEVCKPSNFIRIPREDEDLPKGRHDMPFMEYTPENIGRHWSDVYERWLEEDE